MPRGPSFGRRDLLAWSLGSVAVGACGGSKPDAAAPGGEPKVDVDGDPFALLPGAAIALGQVDAQAFYASAAVAAQLALLSERLLPIGQEAGFVASRDVTRVVSGVYSSGGVEVAAVIRGRFDEAKIARASEERRKTAGGALIVPTPFAGRMMYTVGNVGFAVLSEGTAIAGTDWGIKRTLEKIQDRRVKRTFHPWMLETVESPGAQMALAIDLANQPVAKAAVGAIDLPWLRGLRAARVIGKFHHASGAGEAKPGTMSFAATLTYGDEKAAASAADGVRTASSWIGVLSRLHVVPRIQDLEVSTEKADVRCKFGVDEEGLRALLALAPGALAR